MKKALLIKINWKQGVPINMITGYHKFFHFHYSFYFRCFQQVLVFNLNIGVAILNRLLILPDHMVW